MQDFTMTTYLRTSHQYIFSSMQCSFSLESIPPICVMQNHVSIAFCEAAWTCAPQSDEVRVSSLKILNVKRLIVSHQTADNDSNTHISS